MNEILKKRNNVDLYLRSCFPRASSWEIEKIRDDWDNKERAAEGLYDDFIKRAGDPFGENVLEVGFGNGLQVAVFAQKGAKVSGVEVEPILYDIALGNLAERNVIADLRLYDGIKMPFEDNFFDYIYTTSVFEHVSDLPNVLNEIQRILKPEGKVYVSFPNRLWPRETHTGIWFANYFPISIAGKLLKIFKRSTVEDWNLHFLSFFYVKRF